MRANGSAGNAGTVSLVIWRAMPLMPGNSALSPISRDSLGGSRFVSISAARAPNRHQRVAPLPATRASRISSETIDGLGMPNGKRSSGLPGKTTSATKLISPSHQNAARRVPCPNCHRHHQVALLKPALTHRIAQDRKDRTSCGVCESIDIHQYLGVIQSESLLHGANDAQVRLMRHN